ncbi:MAG: SDR family oxidoreductase [Candidatus Kapaibacterium sp.]|nr:SDR family oxidoreductase [Ignavibacteriota bacterium]
MIKGKTILITGSTRGIGWAIATKLAGEGANVIVTGRRETALSNLSKNMSYYQVDFAKYEKIIEFRELLINNNISIDILINNAGNTIVKDFKDMTIEDFDTVNDLNYRSVFATTSLFLNDLIQNQGGIVNILSVAVTDVFVGNSLYSASKSAVSTMMKVLREEVREDRVDVVNVYPGATSTDLWPDDLRKEHEHRMLKPEDVANAILPTIEAITEQIATIEEIVIRPKLGNI